jgi:OHCU decarboxylase
MKIAERINGDDGPQLLVNCCAATAWVEGMLALRPFANDEAVIAAAHDVAERQLSDDDWLEAFAAHPTIGDVESLRQKYAATRQIAAGEQAGVAGAHESTLRDLAELNREYFKRYGFIFIVCAAGKSAEQMLAILRTRIGNCRDEEIQNAAEEQMQITELRLRKLAEG